MNYKSYDDLAIDIKNNIHKLHDKKFDLIIGVPRSGMIPTFMIGLYLNVNVTDVNSFINNTTVSKGTTRKSNGQLHSYHDAGNILLVDDSILSGNAINSALESIPKNLRNKITTLAIYSSSNKRKDIDMFFEYLPCPRVFEWNIYHRSLLSRSCVDIDGVLCMDPTNEENDDGEKYIEFLLTAKPKFIPSYKIHSLVTNRLEKYRCYTEQWLRKYDVKYDKLIMLDMNSKAERINSGAHSIHKSGYYKESGLDFFIESDTAQAIDIMKMSGKPVFCVDSNQIYSPGFGHELIKQPKKIIVSKMEKIIRALPKPIKDKIKKIIFWM